MHLKRVHIELISFLLLLNNNNMLAIIYNCELINHNTLTTVTIITGVIIKKSIK